MRGIRFEPLKPSPSLTEPSLSRPLITVMQEMMEMMDHALLLGKEVLFAIGTLPVRP